MKPATTKLLWAGKQQQMDLAERELEGGMGGSRAVDVLREVSAGGLGPRANGKWPGCHRDKLGDFYIKTAVRRRNTYITVTPSTSVIGHLHVGRKLDIVFSFCSM